MKGKAVYTIKVYGGNRIIYPLLLKLNNILRWEVTFMPWPLDPGGVEPWYPRIGEQKTRWRSWLHVELFEQKTSGNPE
jgi:hypothetical protein